MIEIEFVAGSVLAIVVFVVDLRLVLLVLAIVDSDSEAVSVHLDIAGLVVDFADSFGLVLMTVKAG